MNTAIGWVSLVLIAYTLVALFIVEGGAKKVLTIASASGDFQAEAKAVLAKGYRARYLWVKRHAAQLPVEARLIAARVVAFNISCWAALGVLVILYGLHFVAP